MNREIVLPGGAGVYPLTGDILSTAGNATVTVTGLQGIGIDPVNPSTGANLQYSSATQKWEPTLRAAIQVNGVTASDDGLISVNVAKQTLVNGA